MVKKKWHGKTIFPEEQSRDRSKREDEVDSSWYLQTSLSLLLSLSLPLILVFFMFQKHKKVY